MKEIAIATGFKNKDILQFLYANMKSRLDFCKTLITSYTDSNFAYLLFACEKDFYEPCEAIVKDIIIEYIETVYKADYIKGRIKNNSNSLAYNAYIKVLSLFDKSTDENALKKIIIFNQIFFIDSFLEFRLAPLKKHWDNLANLSKENLTLFNSESFVDVIKYLINTMESEVYKVKVVCDGDSFSVYNIKSKNDKIQKIAECSNALELFTNVINSCPNYIDVYTNNNNEAVSFLSNVFSNRLKIYNKN